MPDRRGTFPRRAGPSACPSTPETIAANFGRLLGTQWGTPPTRKAMRANQSAFLEFLSRQNCRIRLQLQKPRENLIACLGWFTHFYSRIMCLGCQFRRRLHVTAADHEDRSVKTACQSGPSTSDENPLPREQLRPHVSPEHHRRQRQQRAVTEVHRAEGRRDASPAPAAPRSRDTSRRTSPRSRIRSAGTARRAKSTRRRRAGRASPAPRRRRRTGSARGSRKAGRRGSVEAAPAPDQDQQAKIDPGARGGADGEADRAEISRKRDFQRDIDGQAREETKRRRLACRRATGTSRPPSGSAPSARGRTHRPPAHAPSAAPRRRRTRRAYRRRG